MPGGLCRQSRGFELKRLRLIRLNPRLLRKEEWGGTASMREDGVNLEVCTLAKGEQVRVEKSHLDDKKGVEGETTESMVQWLWLRDREKERKEGACRRECSL